MKYYEYDTDDMIAALATPWGESAIAVIRTTGQGCIEALSAAFDGRKKLDESAPYLMNYGTLKDPGTGRKMDEIIAGIYKKPRSYTGQDMVEIFCHGSMAGIMEILKMLRSIGFRDAKPGEFTLRAFLNGKMDLTRAEAVNEIIKSKSVKAMDIALQRLSGTVFNRINHIKNLVAEILAGTELMLDYAEDEADPEATLDKEKIEEAISLLKELASTYKIGKIIQDGVSVVLAGKTNAGKSSLFNLFNKRERSIVSEIHGTTRDYIESFLLIGEIPVKLYDTAGLRDAENPVDNLVEQQGIKKTIEIMEKSDIILYLVDGKAGLDNDDISRINSFDSNKLIKIWNKADIALEKSPIGFIDICALTGEGFKELELEIKKRIGAEKIEVNDAVIIDSERQKNLIDEAIKALSNSLVSVNENMPLDLIAVDIKEALDSLGEITGEITSSDILELMFSKFCVGK
ncbi:MAG: tRNA uridine-5-carboxymethylaminomethyl(34) synthesis GTPase MnmE [Spirochaetaceae bacterium]|nr:tRNA uridine-5-carboxymethylaminomethyl(34) synthesis GTPase MnmE [Spirochaetaceae bacterium]